MSGIAIAEVDVNALRSTNKRHPNGLYSIGGHPAKGTRKPIGIASCIRLMNNPKWYEGSALYKLDPHIQLFEYGVMSEVQYVIVANVPSDGESANIVTIFAATGNGSLFGRFADFGDMHSAEIGPRLVGSKSHKRVLSALQGGYRVDTSAMKERSKINRSRKREDNAQHQ